MQCLTPELDAVLAASPDLVVWKKPDLSWLGCNDSAAKMFGFKQRQDAVGAMDHDCPEKRIAELAEIWNDSDRKALTGKPLRRLEVIPDFVDPLIYVQKSLVRGQDGSPHMILVHALSVRCGLLADFAKAAMKLYWGESTKGLNLSIEPTFNKWRLSPRESEVLFWSLRGVKGSALADQLGVSPRTIETHFEHIKNKMGAQSQKDVMEKVIAAGLLYVVPAHLVGPIAQTSSPSS